MTRSSIPRSRQISIARWLVMCARGEYRGRVLGDREGVDAGPGEQGGRGQAGGAGSHDQHVGGRWSPA